MTEKTCEIVTLYESNFRDVTKTLRAIADEIDAGIHGYVKSFTLTLDADELEIFAGGENDTSHTILDLQRAIHKIIKMIDD